MRRKRTLTLAFALVTLAAAAGSAQAKVCEAGRLICGTTMPVGGYCECTARGTTEGGTVMDRPMSRKPVNATAGGCGAQPNAPGCR